jgi:hypothetical protein
MMQPVFFMCGVNNAGTTFVIKPVDPARRKPFAPEFFLSEWVRKGCDESRGALGETLLRLLKVHYPAAFKAVSLTPPQVRLTHAQVPAGEKSAQVVALAPFDWHGAMREACLAVGINYACDALRIAPFSGGRRDGMGESVPLQRLDHLGAQQAWRVVGELVLPVLAAMHPDVFAPYPELVRQR